MAEAVRNMQYSFKRYEKKYLIDRGQRDNLLKLIRQEMLPDIYPQYSIHNIYYDTECFDLIRRSINKPTYKEKIRLRSYGSPLDNTPVFIEIKKKYKGIVYKRRVSLPYIEAIGYLKSGKIDSKKGQILREIDYAMGFYIPEPKAFISYDRTAFFSEKDSNMRLTFDENIYGRNYDLDLQTGAFGTRILEEDYFIMEIKHSGPVPLWLARGMSEFEIYSTSFSKYGSFYRHIIEESRKERAYAAHI